MDAQNVITIRKTKVSLHRRDKGSFWSEEEQAVSGKASPYKKRFAQGATIVPRSFWFVKIKSAPSGFDPNVPPLETADRAIEQAKPTYKDVRMDGAVESRFLYASLLSTDLLPFGHLNYRLVVLPIESKLDHYELLEINQARKQGYLGLAKWLNKAQKEWELLRGSKAKTMSIYDRLDRVHALTGQNPKSKYRVIYNTSGTFLTAAVIESKKIVFDMDRARGRSERIYGQ